MVCLYGDFPWRTVNVITRGHLSFSQFKRPRWSQVGYTLGKVRWCWRQPWSAWWSCVAWPLAEPGAELFFLAMALWWIISRKKDGHARTGGTIFRDTQLEDLLSLKVMTKFNSSWSGFVISFSFPLFFWIAWQPRFDGFGCEGCEGEMMGNAWSLCHTWLASLLYFTTFKSYHSSLALRLLKMFEC